MEQIERRNTSGGVGLFEFSVGFFMGSRAIYLFAGDIVTTDAGKKVGK